MNSYVESYLAESAKIISELDISQIDSLAMGLWEVGAGSGRVFTLGIGGSSATAAHAASDLRKICGIQSYCASESGTEISARINDDGWEAAYVGWLQASNLGPQDALWIFSVGGGDEELGVSVPLIRAMEFAVVQGAKVFAVVGRNGGAAKRFASACVLIPPLFFDRVTPHTEGTAAMIMHLITSHPALVMSDKLSRPFQEPAHRHAPSLDQ